MAIGSHQSAKMLTDEWLTPRSIIEALGPFDLDPCSPIDRPWSTAKKHYTKEDNGLLQPWDGLVWCNPPYGQETHKWLNRCSLHNNCLVMIPARTETRMWFDYVWYHAKLIVFLKGRPHFYHVDGRRAKGNSGAPIVIIAYGKEASRRIEHAVLASRLRVIRGRIVYLDNLQTP